ncbi:MAG: DUF3592 domain-containing protein [Planctomycetaceae bacterium]|jgi:hypothetical protein|nr:DUF3592 domain-containing protein [Planctomycetaceae bacterium]
MAAFGKKPEIDLVGILWDLLMRYAIIRLTVALLLAVACIIWGIVSYNNNALLAKNGVETEGVVVSIREEVGRKSRVITQYGMIEYIDKKGNSYQIEHGQQKISNSLNVGDKFPILYLPDKPQKAALKSHVEISTKSKFPFHKFIFVASLFFWAAVAYNIYFMIRYKTIW